MFLLTAVLLMSFASVTPSVSDSVGSSFNSSSVAGKFQSECCCILEGSRTDLPVR